MKASMFARGKKKETKSFDFLKSDTKHPFILNPKKRDSIISFKQMIRKNWKLINKWALI